MTSPEFDKRMNDNRNNEKESDRIKSNLENVVNTLIITVVSLLIGGVVVLVLNWLR